MHRDCIRFLRRGEVVELHQVEPNETVLDYLRLREGARGTKEGCAEGDCGACTVAIGSLGDRQVTYQPVNSCIQLLSMLDAKQLVVVDELGSTSALHPVQQAMVENHASQCGFCTPGLVMSLFTLYQADLKPDRQQINDWLAGNLCRCTGYRPIVEAALQSCANPPEDRYAATRRETAAQLAKLGDSSDIFIGDHAKFVAAPASMAALAKLYARYPDATLVAGATDVGLWFTKQLQRLPRIIWLGRVAELQRVEETPSTVIVGATATYADVESSLARIDPDLGELVRRLGSKQIRALGTLGGNVANGSPIGDMPPALIALEATVELNGENGARQLALEDFFVAYGRQDRRSGEFVAHIRVPKLGPGQVFRCYKISKRFDQDISALLGAFRFTLAEGRVEQVRIAYGGMAETPKRAVLTERAVTGLELSDAAGWQHAGQALANDFQPISDMRASAGYRLQTARALLEKARFEISGEQSDTTRVRGIREQRRPST